MSLENHHIDFAHSLADTAGAVLRRYFRSPLKVEQKADASPVTRADREAEQAMRELILAQYPEHGIIGEEDGNHHAGADYVWVLDPIDGTKAFIAGIPLFGSLIALLHRSKPILGIIDQPISLERWEGQYDKALLNGHPIHSSACSTLAEARLSTTSPYLFADGKKPAFEALRSSVKMTSYGGDCYAYGLLASGHIDVILESGLKPYDFMAVLPVIQAAGGVATDWKGQTLGLISDGDILAAATPALHAAALKKIQG